MSDTAKVIRELQDMVSTKETMITFVQMFKTVVETLAKIKADNDAALENLEKNVAAMESRVAALRDGKAGRDGKNYVLTQKYKRDIARSIEVPIVEKVIETVTREIPTVTEVALQDTAEDIRNKLELLEGDDRLDMSAIKDLKERLDDLEKRASRVGGTTFAVSRGAVKAYDLSSQLNGVTTTFTMPAMWRVISVQLTSSPTILRPTVDFTWTPNSITFTSQIDAATALSAGQTCIVLYAEA